MYRVIFPGCWITNGHCALAESAGSLSKIAVGGPMYVCIQSQITILSHKHIFIHINFLMKCSIWKTLGRLRFSHSLAQNWVKLCSAFIQHHIKPYKQSLPWPLASKSLNKQVDAMGMMEWELFGKLFLVFSLILGTNASLISRLAKRLLNTFIRNK